MFSKCITFKKSVMTSPNRNLQLGSSDAVALTVVYVNYSDANAAFSTGSTNYRSPVFAVSATHMRAL